MAEDTDDKTEQASPRKKQQAREKGNVPRSRDLTAIIPLWMVYMYLSFGGVIFTSMLVYMRSALKRGFEVSLTETVFVELFKEDSVNLALMMAPLFGLMVVVIIAVHFLQTGFLVSAASLSPDFSKVNPLKGIKKYFSFNTLFETVKGIFKLLVLGMILYLILKKEAINLPLLVDMDIQSIMGFSYTQIRKLLFISALVLSVFAVADFVFQRWQHERNLRMTKQEVKEEHKMMEGDPRVKARIRSLQREMARKRMMQEIPKADVVITNPTHFAVALKYDSSKMGAPTIIAKGANLVAEKIKEIARENKVPMFEDKPLARTLFKLNIGQEIPDALYKAVATVLASVYKLKKKGASSQ